MASPEIRPARQEDCAGIAEFRARMEGGGHLASIRDARFYQHKYLTRGRALVLDDDGRIGGTIAATPKQVRIGDHVLAAADLGDLFLDPKLRGRGLFRHMHDELVHSLEADGVGMVTSRPGPAAEPVFREALGYQALLPVREWVAALDAKGLRALPLGRLPVLRLALPRARRGLSVPDSESISRPAAPTELDPPDPFGAGWPVAGTVRDPAWLERRYANDPTAYRTVAVTQERRVVAMAVHLVLDDPGNGLVRAWIVDAWTAAGNASGALPLCSAVLDDARHSGASVIHFWSSDGPGRRVDPIAHALRRLGLRGVSRGKQVLYRSLAGGNVPDVGGADEWLFRAGDTDGI